MPTNKINDFICHAFLKPTLNLNDYITKSPVANKKHRQDPPDSVGFQNQFEIRCAEGGPCFLPRKNAALLPYRSELELSLHFPASVICKLPLQSFFSRKDRYDQDRAFDYTDHQSHHAYRRIRGAVHRYLYQHCRYQHDPSGFPPSPAAVLICKAPCFGIPHGPARPVSDKGIYFLRTVLPHQPSAGDHHDRIYHIADEHKPPHRHFISSFPKAF